MNHTQSYTIRYFDCVHWQDCFALDNINLWVNAEWHYVGHERECHTVHIMKRLNHEPGNISGTEGRQLASRDSQNLNGIWIRKNFTYNNEQNHPKSVENPMEQ